MTLIRRNPPPRAAAPHDPRELYANRGQISETHADLGSGGIHGRGGRSPESPTSRVIAEIGKAKAPNLTADHTDLKMHNLPRRHPDNEE
jgi:hypothetical protein